MLDGFVEIIKFVGGLGGLASASFLIYDRVIRSRPSVFLFPADYKANIRFKNVATETIIIDKITISRPLLVVKFSNDLKTVNMDRSWYGKDKDDRVLTIIKEMGQRSFPVHGASAEFEHVPDSERIKIKARWRNTRAPFPISRHVTIKTTAGEIRQLREASLANKV